MVTKHERALYLSDIDPGMYTAEYLEAWFFEVQLKNFLREKYGEDWFRKEEAGNFLKKIWSEGTRFLPTELAREIGYKEINSSYIYEEIINSLEKYS